MCFLSSASLVEIFDRAGFSCCANSNASLQVTAHSSSNRLFWILQTFSRDWCFVPRNQIWEVCWHIHRQNGCFLNKVSDALGLHALWTTVKPYVNVKSRYLTHFEAGRASSLSLSQFTTLRFMTYLLHNSYVIDRAFAISGVISNENQGDKDDSFIL